MPMKREFFAETLTGSTLAGAMGPLPNCRAT